MTPDEQRLEDLAGTAGPRVLAYLARRTSPPDAVADIYQQVLLTIRQLTLPMTAAEKQFRQMMFNSVARNQEDHVKNTAFPWD